jgi:hypothetical protein
MTIHFRTNELEGGVRQGSCIEGITVGVRVMVMVKVKVVVTP